MEAMAIIAAAGLSLNGEQQAEASLNLPEAFWCRDVLKHIRQAARARRCAPDYVLGAVLARIAMLTPPTLVLPALVGTEATFDWYAGLVGSPSATKSSSIAVARELLPTERVDVGDGLPVGSGEGIVQAFLGTVPDPTRKGKNMVRRERTAVMLAVDEGQVMSELSQRNGSILFSMLRTGYTGGDLGQTNASTETRRLVVHGTYRLSAVIAWQPIHAAKLLRDDASGTPQRIQWFHEHDHNAPEVAPEWPGALAWTEPSSIGLGTVMTVPHAVRAEVDAQAVTRLHGNNVSLAEAHSNLARLKAAGLLAILNGQRRELTEEDWHLAGLMMQTSHRVRDHIASIAQWEAKQKSAASDERIIRREVASEEHKELRIKVSMAQSLGRKAYRSGHLTLREATHAVASNNRRVVPIDEALEHAVGMGWLAVDGDGWRPTGKVP